MARKSNAQKAAEAAALAAEQAVETTQELGKIETIDGEVVVTDLEPASKEPVEASVDANGEDLGDVTNQPVETPVIEADEAVDPTEGFVDGEEPTEAPEQDIEATPEEQAVVEAIYDELVESGELQEPEVEYELEDGFTPILRPTMVGDEYTGYIACPRMAFESVQVAGWQGRIDSHPAKNALKSILYWKNINGSATVRCMSSSKFADVV